MKTISLIFLFFCIAAVGFAQDTYNVTFKLENGRADTVLIGYASESNKGLDEFIDTAVLNNGVLHYNMKFKGFVECSIIPFSMIEKFKSGVILPISTIKFYMNDGDIMFIDAKRVGLDLKYTVIGNELSKQIAAFNNAHRSKSQDALDRDRLYYSKKQSENTPEENAAYLALRRKGNLAREIRDLQFVRNNQEIEYSARVLLGISNKDSVLSVYPMLSEKVKGSFFGKILDGMVKGWFASVVGKKLPSFEAMTIKDEKFKLGDQKEKFVLLDFWGSWCTPCIAESADMRALSVEFKDKLKIVGLIANDTREKATAAIAKYGLNWTQLYSEKNEFGTMFGIRGYPHKILLDDKGVIVKIISGTSDRVFVELKEILSR